MWTEKYNEARNQTNIATRFVDKIGNDTNQHDSHSTNGIRNLLHILGYG